MNDPASRLTVARVNDLLSRAGRLPGGARATAVVPEPARTTVVSALQKFGIEYEGDAKGAPRALLLKTPHPDGRFPDEARKEAEFYRVVAPGSPPEVLPSCFEAVAAAADEPAASWVLLEDLSETHEGFADWPVAPTRVACERLVASYAAFHAAWWDDARLGSSIGRFLDDAALAAFGAEVERRWVRFRTMLGDRLDARRAERCERVLQALPRLATRYRTRRHVTIVHGDAHVWNALFPRDATETVRIVDWPGWRIGVATRDLAYMMALHWYPERRARLERPLLHHYHAELVRRGVRGYDVDALVADYRLSAVSLFAIPVWQATEKIPAAIWWSHFERAMLAFDDLGCAELLD